MNRMPSRWTNSSVLALAPTGDPVIEVTRRARSLVSTALDAGWSGPPFDPIVLAELLRVTVVPSDSVLDARTVSTGESGKFRIEFNPNRPSARVRFSLAHEIAHTLFPDCAAHVRNRAAYHELTPDGWQLEALCNIAAAELLMPAGSLPTVDIDAVDAETMIAWRRDYEVSMEALLLRLTRLASSRCAMFCASSPTKHLDRTRAPYQVDYAIGSVSWNVAFLKGIVLAENSIVTECAAVGFTTHGDEKWPGAGDVHLECVAVPPYPGTVQPRVIGLLRPRDTGDKEAGDLLRSVRGDATRPRGEGIRIIAHIVNDATPNWGGRGFAMALNNRFEAAQGNFRRWVADDRRRFVLGSTHISEVGPDVQVATLIAQKGYGKSARPRIRYSALQRGLDELGRYAAERGATVHVPRLGAGQAGGTWNVIEGLIREFVCARGVPVTVYDLPGSATQVTLQPTLEL